MRGGRTDRMVRWIERGLVAVGASCLLWVGATSLSAIVYQVEQSASQERVGQLPHRRDADLVANVLKTTLEAGAPIGRLGIPRIGLTAVVAEGDDEKTLKLAVGQLTVEGLGLPIDPFDPGAYYQAVRTRLFGLAD